MAEDEKKTTGRPVGVPEIAKRRRVSGERLVPRSVRATVGEWMTVDLAAADADTSVSELLITAATSRAKQISRGEAKLLMQALMATRDSLGRLVVALRESGELSEEMRAELRSLDTRLFDLTEDLR